MALCSLVADIPQGTYLNSFCFGFRLKATAGADPLFLAYLFRGPVGRQHLYALSQGATRHNLSKAQFKQIKLLLPEIDEQLAVASILRDADMDIRLLERRLSKTMEFRQGMMQQLLTGRTRLEMAEHAA